MTWLRWETTTPQSDVVGHLAEELRVPLSQALGLYIACCLTFGEHRPDGNASAVTDASLEQWALWTGKPGAFAKAFRARCVSDGTGRDAEGIIRGWWRQLALIERQTADRERKRIHRNPAGSPLESRRNPDGHPQSGARNVKTSRNVVVAVAVQGGAGGKEARIRAALPDTAREAFDGLLRASPNPLELVGALEMIVDGGEVRGATWTHVGTALRDLALAGTARPSGLALRSFVQRAIEGERTSTRRGTAGGLDFEAAARDAEEAARAR